MKVFHFTCYIIAFLSNLSESVTIASPKISSDEENLDKIEEPSSSALRAKVRGATAKLSSQSSYMNEVVNSFFASSDNPVEETSLTDELKILANTEALHSFLISVRRQLHRHPEIMYQESFTSQTIQTILSELGIEFTTGWAKNSHQDVYPGQGGYGIVAEVGKGAPCVILRADMDALPIIESTSDIESFKSTERGKMHACGHDGHITMLLGAAAILKKMENSLQGTIRLMFQPAEEGGAGGKRMIEEGVVTKTPKAQLAFGMHVWPNLPSGTIASRPGTLMAAAETFELIIDGKGGHAAMPHLTIDPIIAAASTIMNLQSIISRNISPLDSGVVSVTQVTSGDAFNVIPSQALVKGTIRALNVEMLMSLRNRLEHVVNASASLYQCTAVIKYSPDYYPNTFNDEKLFASFSKKVASHVSKEGFVRDIEPTMGGEDFAFLAAAIPSTFFFIGQGTGGDEVHHIPPTDYGLHHPKFALDENILKVGVELHLNLALRALKWLETSESKVTSEL